MISRCVAIAVERKAPSADTRRRRIGGPAVFGEAAAQVDS